MTLKIVSVVFDMYIIKRKLPGVILIFAFDETTIMIRGFYYDSRFLERFLWLNNQGPMDCFGMVTQGHNSIPLLEHLK
jgi:hypothetical protein